MVADQGQLGQPEDSSKIVSVNRASVPILKWYSFWDHSGEHYFTRSLDSKSQLHQRTVTTNFPALGERHYFPVNATHCLLKKLMVCKNPMLQEDENDQKSSGKSKSPQCTKNCSRKYAFNLNILVKPKYRLHFDRSIQSDSRITFDASKRRRQCHTIQTSALYAPV